MKTDADFRSELAVLLDGGNAHMTFEEVVEGFPISRINAKTPHMPYSPWHILEHMRRVQRDIVDFIQNPDYVAPEWPQDYFPSPAEKTDEAGWLAIIRDFLADRAILKKLAENSKADLLAPLAHAPDYTIYREILLAADHNAYHTGELALMRQIMNAWLDGGTLYDAE